MEKEESRLISRSLELNYFWIGRGYSNAPVWSTNNSCSSVNDCSLRHQMMRNFLWANAKLGSCKKSLFSNEVLTSFLIIHHLSMQDNLYVNYEHNSWFKISTKSFLDFGPMPPPMGMVGGPPAPGQVIDVPKVSLKGSLITHFYNSLNFEIWLRWKWQNRIDFPIKWWQNFQNAYFK